MPGFKRLIYIPVAILLSGCGTLGTGLGRVKDPNLANLNPAPSKMSPVIVTENGDPQLDPTYMASQADYHYTMGEAMSLEGRSEKAVEEFKLTLIYDPNSVMVRLRLAAEYVRLGMLTEAIDAAETSVEMDPSSDEARLMLGGLYSTLKMFDQALAQYRAILKSNPTHEEASVYVGAILAEQKKYDEAVGHFMILAKASSTKEPERAYYYIGRIRFEQGGDNHLKEAEKAYTQALSKKPDYVEAVMALANVLKEMGRESVGLKMLESFQEKFGPDREVARYLSRIFLDKEQYDKAYVQLEILEGFERDNLNVRVQLALILIEQKKYQSAVVRLEDILAQSPELDKIRYYLGAVYEEMKKPKLAIENYLKVPPGSSYFVDSTIHSAHLFKVVDQPNKSVEVIKNAIEVRDDVPQFYAYYATLLDDAKQFRQAVKMLNKAIEKFPEHAQLHFFLGSMQDRIGDFRGTISSMKRVLEIDEDHVQAMNYLAYTYAEQAVELDQAESLARRALALQPKDGYILDTVGWVLFKKGNVEGAIRYLEAAYKAKNTEAIIAEHLADAYFRQQMLQKARAMYEQAATLETDNDKVGRINDKLAATLRQIENIKRIPASQGKAANNP